MLEMVALGSLRFSVLLIIIAESLKFYIFMSEIIFFILKQIVNLVYFSSSQKTLSSLPKKQNFVNENNFFKCLKKIISYASPKSYLLRMYQQKLLQKFYNMAQ